MNTCVTTSNIKLSLANSKNVIKYYMCVDLSENILQQRINTVAREASTKTRRSRQHPGLLKSDLYGASHGNFTETMFDMYSD